ncbi:ATP-binding protein [Pseudomonas sp. App30]|uniref:ATP-binding protein n=1 Tax=Pseudomonas sp. App30 TaxID=3068990 RepID=UPI003A80323E
MRLWPRTLFGRLVIILVAGMLAAQLLTSSIWFDVRHSQVLEIPTRLIAARVADIVRQAHRDPAQVEALVAMLDSPRFHLSLSDSASTRQERLAESDEPTQRLLEKVVSQRTGYVETLHLLRLDMVDGENKRVGWTQLMAGHPAAGRYLIDVRLPDNRWLQVQALEDQGWSSRTPQDIVLDYILRIYLLRIVVLVLIAMVAVRLAIRPLTQLTEAAQRLGRDIHRAPLLLTGPVEVRRAAEAFNAMQQRLIANLAERTRFLAAISHDLRSPITRLRLRAEKVAEPELQAQLRRDLDDMEQMVASTLEFVAGGQVSEERQPLDINSLLLSLQADFDDLGEHIEVQGRAQQPIPAFARSLKRCVHNLLENAVRYGGQVQVLVEDSDQQLSITIRDHGPGIPEHLLQQVLEPFYRVEGSRNASSGGYGLGLSIANTVAGAHGGSLVLANAAGGGLRAVLRLPR